MEQWDIVCKRCGKYLFTEQRESTAGNIHRLNETNDEFYDEIKAEFYCTKCAKELGYDTEKEYFFCRLGVPFSVNPRHISSYIHHHIHSHKDYQ